MGGNTEVGIETKFKHCDYGRRMDVSQVPELLQLQLINGDSDNDSGALVIGGAVTVARVLEFCKKSFHDKDNSDNTRGWRCLVEMMNWFASHQIRNVATVAGNLVTASPIADLNPVLMALGASVRLQSLSSTMRITTRTVALSKFFLGYRRVDLRKNEIVAQIVVPPTTSNEYVRVYKQARRRDDATTIYPLSMPVSVSNLILSILI